LEPGYADMALDYNHILYNDLFYYLEQKWERKLTDHEKHLLVEGYKFGRQVEAENELKILYAN
jgi:hypothetical protein